MVGPSPAPPVPASAPRSVLVAGASGFLGLSIVAALAGAGYEVRGLARSADRARWVTAAGGVPVPGDLLQPTSLVRASRGCGAIVHVAAGGGTGPAADALAQRVRVEGARNLAAVARANGVRRLVIGSGYWVYADNPGTISEDSPLEPRGESKINLDAERVALAEMARPGLEVVVVRPGMVYGPGSWLFGIIEALRAGRYHVIEEGRNFWSFLSLPDAGTAFRAVLERGRPGAVYNAVDTQPIPWAELVRDLAGRLGSPPAGSISRSEAEREYGAAVAYHLAANRSASSARLRALGWAPSTPDARTGLAPILETML
jgi:2-alkyl-3-oxoalkanoate reductase